MIAPPKVVDIHAFYDESRINIHDYLQLMNKYNVKKVVLSPLSAQQAPKKSEIMLKIQRMLLWNQLLRIVPFIVSKSFYNSDGRMRSIWQLFTRGNKPLNKIMHPDNDTLENLIKVDTKKLKMWYWINPKDGISLSVLNEKLLNPQVIGIQFHAYWHGFDLRILDPYMSLCEQKNIPVYIILGYGKSGDYKYLIKKYPNNIIIFGYGGFPYYRKIWRVIKDKKKKYIDVASHHLDKNIIRKALEILGPRKCFYGSDCPDYSFCDNNGNFDYNLTFQRLDFPFLSNDDLIDIFYKNYEKNISK